MRILVAYATRNGSTAEIARAVGTELERTGADVVVAEIKTLGSIEGYSAVVLGGPIYMGSLDGSVRGFVKRNTGYLTKVPVAAFAVGLAPKNPMPEATTQAMDALRKALDPLSPVSYILFAGKLEQAKVNFLMRKFMEMAKIPFGDFRDWDAISAWARELPEKFKMNT